MTGACPETRPGPVPSPSQPRALSKTPMRIYELAKELNATSSDLLRQAKALGLEVTNTFSSMDEDDESTLRQGYKPKISFEIADANRARAEKAEAKAQAVRQIFAETFDAERALLQATIERAEAAAKEAPSGLGATAPAVAPTPAPIQAPPPAPVADDKPAEPANEAVSAAAQTEPAVEPAAPPVEDSAPAAAEEKAVESPAPAPAPAPKPAPQPPARPKLPPRAFDDDDDEPDVPGVPRRREEYRDPRKTAAKGRDAKGRPLRNGRSAPTPAAAPITVGANAKVISFHGGVRVKDLASTLGLRPNVVIAELMKQGVFASINQTIDATSATKVAQAHGFVVDTGERTKRNAANRQVLPREDEHDAIPEDSPDDLKPRPPVVTFLGHVDHGKTSLMDYIRKAHVAAGEAGGITQHIGAYCLEVAGQPLTFLDTPGHAAFSAMRQRGAHLTDIAVIIIAADDGVMPQTKEAIKAAKDAGVTIMVAINKIDLPQANVQRVMQQLQGEKLTPEEWGGDIVCCPVSAHTGEGVDHLLEMIFLQAEMLELTANPNRRANGSVIEAQMEPGRGPTATVLVTGGTLNVGDAVLCGEYYGKLRALISTSGTRVKSAGPSTAVQIVGLSGVPEAGAEFMVMPNEKRARDVAAKIAEEKKVEALSKAVKAPQSISDIFQRMQNAEKLTLRLVLRADVQGSVEAIEDSIRDIKSEKVAVEIIHSGTGNITASDVQSAGAGENAAIILGFHVSPESGVNSSARHNGIRIKTFSIIYELLDFVKDEMLALLPAEYREVVRGHATIKQIFALNKMGNVAGCAVDDGTIQLKAQGRVLRRKQVVHTGAFASIRHFKGEVDEVDAGQECGIRFENFEDFQEGDVIECFAFEELPKSL